MRRAVNARALTESVGLSVQQAREVFRLIDDHDDNLFDTLGRAIAVLPPAAQPAADYPRARAVIEALGQLYDPRFAAVAQLERALENAEAAGVPLDDGATRDLRPPHPRDRRIRRVEGSRRPRSRPSSTPCSAPRCTSPCSSRCAASPTRTPRRALSATRRALPKPSAPETRSVIE